MTWILDGAVVVVLGLCVVLGVRRGFIRSAVRLIGVIVAIVAAALISTPLAQWVFDSFMKAPLEAMVSQKVTEAAATALSTLEEQIAAVLQHLPETLSEVITAATDVETAFTGSAVEAQELTRLITDQVLQPVCVSLVQVIVFLLLFIVVMIVARILSTALDKLFAKLPVIRQVNGLLGGVIGLAEGVAVVLVLTMALDLYMTMTGADSVVTREQIEQTRLLIYWVQCDWLPGAAI